MHGETMKFYKDVCNCIPAQAISLTRWPYFNVTTNTRAKHTSSLSLLLFYNKLWKIYS